MASWASSYAISPGVGGLLALASAWSAASSAMSADRRPSLLCPPRQDSPARPRGSSRRRRCAGRQRRRGQGVARCGRATRTRSSTGPLIVLLRNRSAFGFNRWERIWERNAAQRLRWRGRRCDGWDGRRLATCAFETREATGDGDRLDITQRSQVRILSPLPVPATKENGPRRRGAFTRSSQRSRFERLRRPCRFRRTVFGLGIG